MRLGPLVLVAAVLAARSAAPVVVDAIPASWAYTVTATCYWQPRPWAERLGADAAPRRTPATLRQRFACEQRRGLASPSPIVRTIQRKWPSAAELTAWRTQDANGDALPAEGPAGDVQGRAGR